jgi:hypothetical protein
MKFSLTFKTPDVLDQIHDLVKEEVREKKPYHTEEVYPPEEQLEEDEDEIEERMIHVQASLEEWIEHGEYITIDFDTTKDTATVRKRK